MIIILSWPVEFQYEEWLFHLTCNWLTIIFTSVSLKLALPVRLLDWPFVEPASKLALKVALKSDCRIAFNIVKEDGFSCSEIPLQSIVYELGMMNLELPLRSRGWFDVPTSISHREKNIKANFCLTPLDERHHLATPFLWNNNLHKKAWRVVTRGFSGNNSSRQW